MRQPQRPYRQPDPRVRRSLALALAGAALLIVSGLVVVGLRVQQVHLAYRLDAVKAERASLEALLRQLEVQVATLRSPARIETRARQLGLVVPARDQVRLAREYVAGTPGLAGLAGRLADAGEGAAGTEPRSRAPLQP